MDPIGLTTTHPVDSSMILASYGLDSELPTLLNFEVSLHFRWKRFTGKGYARYGGRGLVHLAQSNGDITDDVIRWITYQGEFYYKTEGWEISITQWTKKYYYRRGDIKQIEAVKLVSLMNYVKIPPFPLSFWEKCRPRASKTAQGPMAYGPWEASKLPRGG